MRASLVSLLAFLAAVASPLQALPDIPSYPQGSYVMDTGLPGPLVLIVAGLHGDEKSGIAAAKVIIGRYSTAERGRARTLARGSLVVVPVANPFAADLGSRTGKSGLDMNRLFPGGTGSEEASRAVGIFATGRRSDLVLDLHEEGLAWLEADLPTLVTNQAAASLTLDLLDKLGPAGFAFSGGAPAGSLTAELGLVGKSAITVEIPARLHDDERLRLQLLVVDSALKRLGMLW